MNPLKPTEPQADGVNPAIQVQKIDIDNDLTSASPGVLVRAGAAHKFPLARGTRN